LDEKRRETTTKAERQQQALQRIHEARDRERAAQIEKEAEDERIKRDRREKQFEELEGRKRTSWEDHEKRSKEYLSRTLGEGDRVRREGGIGETIRNEERRAMSMRIMNRKGAELCESQKLYEARMKIIEQKEQLKAQVRLEAQIRRNQLEREKYELETGMMSAAEIRKSGIGKLQGLAKQLGIDLEILKAKAKASRRGRSRQEERSSLPPMRPATVNT
jgi:hypothetical protein